MCFYSISQHLNFSLKQQFPEILRSGLLGEKCSIFCTFAGKMVRERKLPLLWGLGTNNARNLTFRNDHEKSGPLNRNVFLLNLPTPRLLHEKAVSRNTAKVPFFAHLQGKWSLRENCLFYEDWGPKTRGIWPSFGPRNPVRWIGMCFCLISQLLNFSLKKQFPEILQSGLVVEKCPFFAHLQWKWSPRENWLCYEDWGPITRWIWPSEMATKNPVRSIGIRFYSISQVLDFSVKKQFSEKAN